MKKIKGMEYLLGFGAILVLFAGLSLIFTADVNIKIQLIGMIVLSGFMLLYSFICKNVLDVEGTSRLTFLISLLSILVTYMLAGFKDMFGSWLSINGDGALILFASILFLIAVLAVLTSIRFKNANFIHVCVTALLGTLFFVFMHFKLDFELVLIIIGSILLIFNVFKINKLLFDFSNVTIFIFSLICVLVGYDNNIIYSTILLVINSIGVINLLHKFKSFESELLSIIIMVLTFFSFVLSGNYDIDFSIIIIMATFILSIMDMAASSLRTFENKFSKISFKLGVSFCFTYMLLAYVDSYSLACLLGSIFMIVASYAQSYTLKNKNYEEFLFPVKVPLFLFIIFTYVNSLNVFKITDNIFFIIVVIYMLANYKLSKYPIYKREGLVLSIMSIIILCGNMYADNIISLVAILLTLLISFMILTEGNIKGVRITLIGLLVIILGMISLINAYEELINPTVYIIGLLFYTALLVLNKNCKINFAISSICLIFVFNAYINQIVTTYDLASVIVSIAAICLTFINAYILFENKDRAIDTFTTIVSGFILFITYSVSQSLLVTLYVLIISLLFIFINVISKTHKVLGYLGFAGAVLTILSMLRYLEGLPTAVYTLIIGLLILGVVSVMVYKYQAKINKMKCSKCGNAYKNGDTFCGNCGNKLM